MSRQSIIIIVAAVAILVLILVFSSIRKPSGTVGLITGDGGDAPSGPVTREALSRNVVIVVPGQDAQNVPDNVAIPQIVSSAGPERGGASFRTFEIGISGNKFSPDTIIAGMGDTVRINFTASGKGYDLVQPDYGWKLNLTAGQSAFTQFDATAAGKFTFFCGSCGGPESGPVGYLTIVPRE